MQSKFRIAAYGVVWDSQGRILLTHGRGRGKNAPTWLLPGGRVEHGENPRDSVVRTCAESTGLTVEVAQARDVISTVSHDVHTNAVVFDVNIVGGSLAPSSGVSTKASWVDPVQVETANTTEIAAAVLGRIVPQSLPGREKIEQRPRPRPPSKAKRGRLQRGQRFGAYGFTTDSAGRVLLARISEGYPGAGCWHLPGGGVDFGEQPVDALVREIAEETGQMAQIEGLMDVTSFRHRRAVGPEGYPLDWHGVRAIYRAHVEDPSEARVVETAGGSTSESRWWDSGDVAGLKVSAALGDALRIAKDMA
ncbi:MAG TPA: NUDIX hydrolase [Candidatus Stackebrandtia faecavium]|nr:NUDIX hydrolase [Candidatus Stackebrandtia faecavium]